jgi:hypothetical protein
MKTKLTRILGVAMTLALLVGLFVTAAPVSAGTNAWSKFAIPSTTGMVLDTGNATGPMVMGSDGTVWAGRGTGAVNGLIKSTDFGNTWSMVTTLTIGATNIMDISVSSIDPLQVYVTDGVDIYKTADGGTTWVTLSALTTTPANDLISSLDVGYIGTDAYIFAATSTFGNSGGGGVYVAQEAVFGMPWSDMLVDTDRAVAWGTTDVTEVMVDPTNFGTTQMVMAVATDTGATATMVTTKYGGAQWDATVPGVTLPGVTANLYGTSTWLPSDFSSSLASGNMQCFIGVDAMTAAQGDVFWVIFGTPGTAFDLNVNGATGMGVSSLDGIGPGNSASMLASGYSAAAVTVPVVLASSAGGAIWTANVKAPTGGATPLGPGTALSEVLIDPVTGNAIVATHGTDSAVSASTDWSVWNGVSLINAAINAISDLSVLGSTVCMVTNQTAGNIDSFWKNSGGVWMRILSSATFGSAFDTHEYADGAHFLTDIGGTAIYRSLTGGATWSTLVSAVPGAITAWEVVDANTIVVGGGANTIYQTTNGGVIWFTRTATGLGTPVDFASDAASGDILAASATNVAVSSDNGATWTTNTTATTNIAAATFGASYATTGEYFITGTSGTFMSSGSSWTQIDDGSSTMTVTAGSGIVSGPGVEDMVYAADSGVAAGAARIRTDDANAEPLAGPAATTFMGLWFTAGSNVLWTIDTAAPAIYTYTDTLNVAGSGVTATPTSTTTLTVSWDALADATGYAVFVNTTAQTTFLTAATLGAVTVSGTTATVTGLTAGTAYNVSVWATVGSGAVSSFLFGGAAVAVSTDLAPPLPPTSFAPAAGAANVPILPTFQWNPPTTGTPTGYLLEVSTVSDFSTTLLSVALPAAETYYAWQGDALEYGTVYYWRVTASGVSSSVPVPSVFTTVAAPIVPPDPPPGDTIILNPTPVEQITPAYIWAIIAVGFVLTVAVIILIVRTRRVV